MELELQLSIHLDVLNQAQMDSVYVAQQITLSQDHQEVVIVILQTIGYLTPYKLHVFAQLDM